ncbi:hypothetical protein TruAng_003781 [Truncatella angustata]|nr:hypothetical protein TruAng_003781 [Truncatella angustata]
MVKIAVAGGSGQVAREVIDALIATQKHDITILSRKEPLSMATLTGIKWKIVDYSDKVTLAETLKGTHTLLSFVQLLSDPEQKSQKNLIDAAIAAGVKRFAPSEYGSKSTVNMPWWDGKEKIREYLKQLNQEAKVLEYTLFQPGLFLDYLAFPHQTAKHIAPLQTVFDFENRRAMMVDGHEDAVMTFTAAADFAAVVAKAVDYSGTWPTTAGIRGNRLTFSQILDIGERVRDASFTVDKLKAVDLQAGNLTASWALETAHQAVSDDQASELLKAVSIGILLSSVRGAWDSSDEMNRLFPTYKFTRADEFLAKVWGGQQ